MNCNNCEDIYPNSDMTRWESCPSSIIADADNYYTKHQVDELIEGASGCCITPEEVDEKISEAVSGKQDTLIAGSGITISGNVISADGADLSNYYKKSETSGKTEIANALNALDNKKLDASAYTPTDLSNYYKKSETSGKTEIANALNALDNKKLDASAYTPTDLSNYYTKSETSGKTELSTAFNSKQDTLTAGSGISIVNNVISATGGGGGIVDPSLDGDSPNAVANSAITEALNDKLDSSGYTQPIQSDWNQTNNGRLDYIKNKPTIPEVPTEISSFHNDVGYITTASTIFNNYATTANTYTKQEVDNKFWCGTEQEYQNLPTKQNNVLYLIHE